MRRLLGIAAILLMGSNAVGATRIDDRDFVARYNKAVQLTGGEAIRDVRKVKGDGEAIFATREFDMRRDRYARAGLVSPAVQRKTKLSLVRRDDGSLIGFSVLGTRSDPVNQLDFLYAVTSIDSMLRPTASLDDVQAFSGKLKLLRDVGDPTLGQPASADNGSALFICDTRPKGDVACMISLKNER